MIKWSLWTDKKYRDENELCGNEAAYQNTWGLSSLEGENEGKSTVILETDWYANEELWEARLVALVK